MEVSLEAEVEPEYGISNKAISCWPKLSAVHQLKHADAAVRCWMR